MSNCIFFDDKKSLKLQVTNSFYEKYERTFFKKYSVLFLFFFFIFSSYFAYSNRNFFNDLMDSQYDEMEITLTGNSFDPNDMKNRRDVNQNKKKSQQKKEKIITITIDEIFGNEYLIKEKKKKKKKQKEQKALQEEKKLDNTMPPIFGEATVPVDLNPEIQPIYNSTARNAGVQGNLFVELIIDEKGNVKRAKILGNKLGYGLDKSTIDAYQKKKFKPSINKKGKSMMVKIVERVTFSLY